MALFEIIYLNMDTDQERIESYSIYTLLLDDASLDKLWTITLEHAMKSKKDSELVSKIEFIAW